jgi:hypothetical protein
MKIYKINALEIEIFYFLNKSFILVAVQSKREYVNPKNILIIASISI